MIPINAKFEGKIYSLYELEQKLKPLGYVIGGNWEYDHGSFDYKIDQDDGYQFLRLPFQSVDGQLDAAGATVKMRQPFLLAHLFEAGIDDKAGVGNFAASFDQFAEPVDADAKFPEKYIDLGKTLVKEVEDILL